jgi:hypothetical protein
MQVANLTSIRTLLVALAFTGLGCFGNAPTPPQVETGALTFDEWKSLPPETRYEEVTVERLRSSDPRLRSESAWAAFVRKNITPLRKQELQDQIAADARKQN